MHKLRPFFISGLLLVALIGIFLLFRPRENQPSFFQPQTQNYPSPEPTLGQTEISEAQQQAENDQDFQKHFDAYTEKTPLLYLMPVKTDSFLIDYQGDTVYTITLFGTDREKARQEALDWWRANDIDPQTLNLIWQ